MPLLNGLTKDEQEALIHKLRNSGSKNGDKFTDILVSGMVNKNLEEKLAKLSEDENFNVKNRYRL